jgi:hypothetical protein
MFQPDTAQHAEMFRSFLKCGDMKKLGNAGQSPGATIETLEGTARHRIETWRGKNRLVFARQHVANPANSEPERKPL